MNFILEEPLHSSMVSGHHHHHHDRNHHKITPKNKPLRLDSPTTIAACEELGLVTDDLKQKPIEDFKDPTVEENIVQIRYNHYLKRFNQAIKDVMARKRLIARRIRTEQLEQQQLHLDQHTPEGMRSKSGEFFHVGGSLSLSRSPTAGGLFSPITIVPSPMAANVNKTLCYFRKSHATAETKDLEQILGIEENRDLDMSSPVLKLERTLSQEVHRFNRAKRQKQREAKEAYSAELNRKKMKESLLEREKKRQETEKKAAMIRAKKAEEKKRYDEEKMERIKEAERNYAMHLLEEKDKIQQKHDGKKKFGDETGDKKKKLGERDPMNETKRKQVFSRKEQLDREGLRLGDELKEKIDAHINKATENRQDSLNVIKSKMRFQLQRSGSVEKIRRFQTQESSEFIHSFVDKKIKREDTLQNFKLKCAKDMKQRELESQAREKRFSENYIQVEEKNQEKMKTLNDKYNKISELIEAKRTLDEKNRKEKQEMNRLKLADKLENHIRLDRRIQFEKLKVLEKERREQERVVWAKYQKEIAQKAKLEVSIQAKIQREKIEESINILTKKVYEAPSSQVVTDGQKKLLKVVLQPSDYEIIEGKEMKKEEERLEMLERQERGQDRSRSASPARRK